MPTLQWSSKNEAVTASKNCKYRLLVRNEDQSYGAEDTENMLIQGDNLEALRALIPTHAGRVNFIYIDPPYNTKTAFESYDDNMAHSKWLSMMYPRLELLWKLLAEDGVICISINDDEGHYLKVMCDEIFGRSNFISSLVWNYEGNTDNQAKIINYHEYVHVYAKSGRIEAIDVIDPNIDKNSKLFKKEIRNTVVKNGPKNPPREVTIPAGFPANIENATINKENIEWPQYDADIEIRDYKLVNEVKATSGWASRKLLENFIKEGMSTPVKDTKKQDTVFELTKTGAIEGVKGRKQESKGHFVSVLRGFGTTNQMRIMLEKMGMKFSYPKPVNLVSYLAAAFCPKNGIVLDSFAGSGTTAHSILESNRVYDANRSFVCIEMREDTFENVIIPRTKAVIDGNSEAEIEACGGGYSSYQLGKELFDEYGYVADGVCLDDLASHIWFTETKSSLKNNANSPLLGVYNDVAYYFLRGEYNQTLTTKVLQSLPEHDGPKVIYGENIKMTQARLKEQQVTFKQIPTDIRG
ncbi:site-specific DNA-methyltransferase [Vibrio lentus]|uniref:site-specific DNA-methyltransferase n=1 Tax=Vibrio lentus TaxID=136468 RepID=UPI000C860209|nr:site-specific DNA-methyltransferase [Vibrio lentus]PMI56276.1 hypothetical protein BCU41_11480 [Vibrio lentus]